MSERTRYSWLHDAWLRLHEPRYISATYGAWWALATLLGGYSVVNPPRTIEYVAGDILMTIISLCLIVGGVIGTISVALGTYWSERAAVGFVATGIGGYLLMVLYLWIFNDGHRGLQVLALTGAIILTLLRSHWVGERPYSTEHRNRNRLSPSADD